MNGASAIPSEMMLDSVIIFKLLVVMWLVTVGLGSKRSVNGRKEDKEALLDQVTHRNGLNNRKRQMSPLDRLYSEVTAHSRSLDEPHIMFWRPQKVGSSTIESILISYAYRHYILPRMRLEKVKSANLLCSMIALCGLAKADSTRSYSTHRDELKHIIYMMLSTASISDKRNMNIERSEAILKMFKAEDTIVPYQYKLSSNHQICNLPYHIVNNEIHCAFSSNLTETIHTNKKPKDFHIKQVFAVREPLSRAISVYYYWGECYKVGKLLDDRGAKAKGRFKQMGSFNTTEPIQGPHLLYHGQETTVPPIDIANAYASNLPYVAGFPGPSYTWSTFSDSYEDAVEQIYKDDIMTIVIERIDESLVVLAHYFGWSLADVTQTISKKTSSPHPKYGSWPSEAVKLMRQALVDKGEFAVYDASNKKLDGRIKNLRTAGFDVEGEVALLKRLKQEVAVTCGNLTYLEHYREVLRRDNLKQRGVVNKLREVDDVYFQKGHVFTYGTEIMYSFDICNSCEAHAILYSIKNTQGYMKSSTENTMNHAINRKTNLLALAAVEDVATLPQFAKCM